MKIAVLRGGRSPYYDQSLKSGEMVLSHLRSLPEKYEPVDIFISRDGEWHVGGLVRKPEQALAGTEFVWNALHGTDGLDEELSETLNGLSLAHTGQTPEALALAGNRAEAKRLYAKGGLAHPKHIVVSGDTTLDELIEIFRGHLSPVHVKPIRRGTLASRIVRTFEELKEAVTGAFRHSDEVMVEEHVRGKHVWCGVIEGLRGQELYSLLPVPSSFNREIHDRLAAQSRLAHVATGLKRYSLSEFIITPKGKIYILGTTAHPPLGGQDGLTSAFHQVGLKPEDFFDHIIGISR